MRIAALCLILSGLCFISRSYAQTIDMHPFHFGDTLEMPTIEDALSPDSEFIQSKKSFFLKASYDFTNDLVTGSTPSRTSLFPFVKDMQTLTLGGGVLAHKRLLISINAPIHYTRLANGYVTVQDPNAVRWGDLSLHAKYRLTGDQARIHLALRPEFTFPTGNDAYFISNDSYGFAGKILTDTNVGSWKLFANAGISYASNATFSTIDRKTRFDYALGIAHSLTEDLFFTGEWSQSIAFSDPSKSQNPTVMSLGLRYRLESISLFAGGGFHRLKFTNYNLPLSFYTGIKVPFGFEPTKKERSISSSMPSAQTTVTESSEITSKIEAISSSVIRFKNNSFTILPESKQLLDEVVSNIADVQQQIEMIVLHGYCDPRGNDAYNQILSEKRAKTVKSYLIQHGVNAKLIQTEGKGEISSQKPKEYPSLRKVEFKVIRNSETTH